MVDPNADARTHGSWPKSKPSSDTLNARRGRILAYNRHTLWNSDGGVREKGSIVRSGAIEDLFGVARDVRGVSGGSVESMIGK